MLIGLDLFSGIGGLSLALVPWIRPIAYCEHDSYAQGVLLSRMSDGSLPRAPIWDDVRTLNAGLLGTRPDIIYGGFPCQDISSEGNGVGLGGSRSGLFNHITRLVEETNPSFVFLENVPAIRTRGLNSVAQTFTDLGYDCRWTIVSAKEVGACHLRKRWFMLAHHNRPRIWNEPRRISRAAEKMERVNSDDGPKEYDTNPDGERLERQPWKESRISRPAPYHGWQSQPTICRGDNGISNRVDRIKCLGNAVVPLQARNAFKKLMGLKEPADE